MLWMCLLELSQDEIGNEYDIPEGHQDAAFGNANLAAQENIAYGNDNLSIQDNLAYDSAYI